ADEADYVEGGQQLHCGKCDRKIRAGHSGTPCAQCHRVFHRACTTISRWRPAEGASWICQPCAANNRSRTAENTGETEPPQRPSLARNSSERPLAAARAGRCAECKRFRRRGQGAECKNCGKKVHWSCCHRTYTRRQIEGLKHRGWTCNECAHEAAAKPEGTALPPPPPAAGQAQTADGQQRPAGCSGEPKTSKLTIIQWNCDHFKAKEPELKELVRQQDADVIMLQESKLKAEDELLAWPGYTVLRADRNRHRQHHSARGGGLVTIIRHGLRFERIQAPVTNSPLEMLGVRLYFEANSGQATCNMAAAELAQIPGGENLLLAGDWNAHHELWDNNSPRDRRGEELADWMDEQMLTALNDGSTTRTSWDGEHRSSPDVTIVPQAELDQWEWRTANRLSSDHLPIIISRRAENADPDPTTRKIMRWNWKKADWPLYQRLVRTAANVPGEGGPQAVGMVARKTRNAEFIDEEVQLLTAERDNIRMSEGIESEDWKHLDRQIKQKQQENKRERWRDKLDSNATADKMWSLLKQLNGAAPPPPRAGTRSLSTKAKGTSRTEPRPTSLRKYTPRLACVRVGDVDSKRELFQQGLPQGSVLSPLLFIVFIDDLLRQLDAIPDLQVSGYADDLATWTSSRRVAEALSTQQKAVDTLEAWSKAWLLPVATGKCSLTLFSSDPAMTPQRAGATNVVLQGQTMQWVEQPKFLGLTFDRQLRFTAHADNVIHSCRNRLNLMRRLAGSSWGWQAELIRNTYVALIRSKMLYGACAWMPWLTCAAWRKLEVVQHSAERIITGAVATTPVEALRCESGMMSIREQSEVIWSAKLDRWLRLEHSSPRYRLGTQQTRQRLKRLGWRAQARKGLANTGLAEVARLEDMSDLPPWQSWRDNISFLVSTDDARKESRAGNLEMAQAKINQASPDPDITIFTDGSVRREGGGSGAVIYRSGRLTGEQVGDQISLRRAAGQPASSLQAELTALELAVEWLSEQPAWRTALIASDSKSGLLAVQGRGRNPIATKIRQLLSRTCQTGREIALCWTPAHCGLEGNEAADEVAGGATALPQAEAGVLASVVRRRLAAVAKAASQNSRHWSHERSKDTYGHLGTARHPAYKNRAEAVSFIRFRTGHSLELRAYCRRIGRTTDAMCPACGTEEETVEHVSSQCPATEIRRRLDGPTELHHLNEHPEEALRYWAWYRTNDDIWQQAPVQQQTPPVPVVRKSLRLQDKPREASGLLSGRHTAAAAASSSQDPVSFEMETAAAAGGSTSAGVENRTSGQVGLQRGLSVKRISLFNTPIESINAERARDPVDMQLDEEALFTSGGIPAKNSHGDRLFLFTGIIDILQSYRLFKKMEHAMKSIITDGDTVSVHNPRFYSDRFQLFLKTEVFKKQPDASEPQESLSQSLLPPRQSSFKFRRTASLAQARKKIRTRASTMEAADRPSSELIDGLLASADIQSPVDGDSAERRNSHQHQQMELRDLNQDKGRRERPEPPRQQSPEREISAE
uniref:RNase H domain-containing protein n=1 Tax=Macrostomum lignano TaxID=282301 RepID=A0A1I8IFP6_9PLAT